MRYSPYGDFFKKGHGIRFAIISHGTPRATFSILLYGKNRIHFFIKLWEKNHLGREKNRRIFAFSFGGLVSSESFSAQ